MSITDPTADPVQPEEGQGEQATPDTPYSEYLARIPEEVRGDVEPIFKEWDANTTRRFQDASEYKQSWKPYEELGVNQRDPEEVQWALDMLEAAKNNPQGVQEWFTDYAKERGLTPAEQAQQYADDQEFVDPTVQSLVERRLQEQLAPFSQQLGQLTEWQQKQEQQYQEQQRLSQYRSTWDEMKAKHGADFNEPMVEKLVGNYGGEEPAKAIERAFQDWTAIRNQIEKDVLQAKADAPQGAEAGGVADGTPPPVDSIKRASEIALEQLRANNRS